MKQQVLLSLILAGSLVAVSAQAQEETSNTSTVKVSDVQKKDEAQKDIDDEITNARMRATLGSKSKWSFKSALGYNGGSIDNPGAEVRPNYRAGADAEALPTLSGTVGVNYRMTERDNLSLTTGVSIVDPLHGDITKPAIDKRGGGEASTARYEISTPSVSWSRGYKAWGMQNISDVSVSYYTDTDSQGTNAWGDISLGQTVLADFGQSNWQGGVSLSGTYGVYSGEIKNDYLYRAAYEAGNYRRMDILVGLYPFAEYSFNDTYSFRTVFGYFEFMKYKDEYGNNNEIFQREPYQSAGIGISVTRDIYLYPNIQFTPKDIRADRTNVALSTNINLF